MYEYGRRLGMAFQIVDDCLDLVGVEKTVGKSLGSDLKNGEPTLPMIHLLRLRRILMAVLSLLVLGGNHRHDSGCIFVKYASFLIHYVRTDN